MTIHFFTKGDTTVASSRQRAHVLATELQRFQVDVVIHAPAIELISQTHWPEKWKLLKQIFQGLGTVKKDDVIFLQRTIYNKYFFIGIIGYKILFRRKMIFDFDDAIYLHSPWKTRILTQLADAVTVGSHELEHWAKRFNAHVFHIPTCTTFAVQPRQQFFSAQSGRDFVIGWAGGATAHLENLALLPPVFAELIRRGVQCRFILAGGRGDPAVHRLFEAVPGLKVEFLEWVDPQKMPQLMQTFDVGLMPLLDTPWNRGKSALKVIEYMACGVAAVASPVGENNYVITDGKNGFLPRTAKDWADTIEQLYRNPEQLPMIGSEANATIQQMYSFDAQIIHLLHILNS